MLIYDKNERELRHRISLSFFVVEILTTQESEAKFNLHIVISPQQRKRIKFYGVILFHFYHRSGTIGTIGTIETVLGDICVS